MKTRSEIRKIRTLQDKYDRLREKNRALQAELKQAKSSELRVSKLFEFAPDGYYLNDLQGNFIDGNRAAVDMLGYDKNELIGKNFLKLKILPKNQLAKAAAVHGQDQPVLLGGRDRQAQSYRTVLVQRVPSAAVSSRRQPRMGLQAHI